MPILAAMLVGAWTASGIRGRRAGAWIHTTGEILATGQHPYSTPENAEVAGERQLRAAATLPTPDHLEPT